MKNNDLANYRQKYNKLMAETDSFFQRIWRIR